jgi:hypothetical protein
MYICFVAVTKRLFSLGRDSNESQDSEKIVSDKKVRFLVEDNAVNNDRDGIDIDGINASGSKSANKQSVSFNLPDENNSSSNGHNSDDLNSIDSNQKTSNLRQRKGTPAPKNIPSLNGPEKNVKFNDDYNENQPNVSRIGTPYPKSDNDNNRGDVSQEKYVRFNDHQNDNQSNISRISNYPKSMNGNHQRDERTVRFDNDNDNNQSNISRIGTPYPKTINNNQNEKTVRFDHDYNNNQSTTRIGTPCPSKRHQNRAQQPEDISDNYPNELQLSIRNTSQFNENDNNNQKNVTFDDIDLTYKSEFNISTPSPYVRKENSGLTINDKIQSRLSTPYIKDKQNVCYDDHAYDELSSTPHEKRYT